MPTTPTTRPPCTGRANGGVLGNERPLSIMIRRFLATDPAAADDLFGESRPLTWCSTTRPPLLRGARRHAGRVGRQRRPLVRYHIVDEGGVTATRRCRLRHARLRPVAAGLDWGIDRCRSCTSSAVAVHCVVLRANIYPENVTVGLEQPEVSDWVTGKFVLEAPEDADRDRVPRGRRGAGAGRGRQSRADAVRERRDPHQYAG